jgi:Asp-tRNA(Asn)/Glu-tRNA(Gln) amidotransferase C subunit
MISTLQSQLHFVRAVQRVDTKGVEPLHAIRDETDQGIQEETITLDKMKGLLDEEVQVGYYKRPKRVKTRVTSDAENWDALATASRRKARFFVVQGKKAGEAA